MQTSNSRSQLTGWVILGVSMLLALCMFTWGTPRTSADHDSCSGINYFSCVTGGRAGSVAGKDGNTYYINDPSPGGICSCSGCLCVPSHDIVIRSGVGTSLDVNGNVIDAGGAGGAVGSINAGGAGGAGSGVAGSSGVIDWNHFFTGFYETNPFDNAVSGSVSGGGGAGGGGAGSGGTGLSNDVNILYKSIYPIRSLTEGGGPGTKTITQQEFDAKYGSYIQR